MRGELMKEEALKNMIAEFMATDPTDTEIESFTVNEVLPHDKRSIVEIMEIHDHLKHWSRCPICKDRRPYEMEHPDFKMPEGVAIPEDFKDYSWHNDEAPNWIYTNCDCFESEEHCRDYPSCIGLRIWISYPERYNEDEWWRVELNGIYSLEASVTGFSDDRGILEFSTSNWSEIEQAIGIWKEGKEFLIDPHLESSIPHEEQPQTFTLTLFALVCTNEMFENGELDDFGKWAMKAQVGDIWNASDGAPAKRVL